MKKRILPLLLPLLVLSLSACSSSKKGGSSGCGETCRIGDHSIVSVKESLPRR